MAATRTTSTMRTRTWLAALAALALAAGGAQGRQGFGGGGQEYGYVDVREGAHMFYWLFYAGGGGDPAGKPLVVWLQGGPGASSTSYGNFEEIGPLDAHLRERNSTWVKYVNVLFIDNPVGTGYSYTDHYSQLCTDNKQIAADLVAFTKAFMAEYPLFQKVPLYVFSESYGGKMTAEFALNLYKEQMAGRVASNLRGIALGDSWISPIDSVLTWAPYLLQTGLVDQRGFDAVDAVARLAEQAVRRGRFYGAMRLWQEAEDAVLRVADDVDFYNVMRKIRRGQARGSLADFRGAAFRLLAGRTSRSADDEVDLDALMDEQVKPVLGVIPDHVKHGAASAAVFDALNTDFMKPVTDIVERLLNDTDVAVAVLSGQLDLIVDTPGTLAWAERLRWDGGDAWVNEAARSPLLVNDVIEGFVKSTGRFSFYWVNRAGHMVPSDNPAAAIEILRRVTGLKPSD